MKIMRTLICRRLHFVIEIMSITSECTICLQLTGRFDLALILHVHPR